MNEFGSGIADADNARDAARAALDDACPEAVDPNDIGFVSVFASPQYDYRALVDTLRAQTDNATLLGASSSGEFTGAGATSESVVVSTITSDEMEFAAGLGTGLSDDIGTAVAEATHDFPAEFESEYTVGINLHDGLVGRGDEVTLQAYQAYQMPYVGGSAGDDRQLDQTTVFANDAVETDAVAIGVLGSDTEFGVGAAHGHEKLSAGYRVTDASGSVVDRLDDRPAYEVWKDAVRDHAAEEFGVDVDALSPSDPNFVKLLTVYEFGIETGDGEYKIRWPGLTEDTAGSLSFATAIPEGTELFVMMSSPEKQKHAQITATEDAVDSLGQPPVGGIAFNCICQADILSDEFSDGVAAAGATVDAPLAGMEVYGEVALSAEDMRGYHNATSSVLLLPE